MRFSLSYVFTGLAVEGEGCKDWRFKNDLGVLSSDFTARGGAFRPNGVSNVLGSGHSDENVESRMELNSSSVTSI